MSSKTLLVLRHAKSDWSNPDLSDFDRPLNERGRTEAAAMARFLHTMQIDPEAWISSGAVRANETIEIIKREAKLSANIICKKELYLCPKEQIAMTMRKNPDLQNTIAVTGHNPGLEEFISSLVSSGTSLIRLTTCCLAIVELSIQKWEDLDNGKGTLRTLISGKTLYQLEKKNG